MFEITRLKMNKIECVLLDSAVIKTNLAITLCLYDERIEQEIKMDLNFLSMIKISFVFVVIAYFFSELENSISKVSLLKILGSNCQIFRDSINEMKLTYLCWLL
jgi:hypothetical protein